MMWKVLLANLMLAVTMGGISGEYSGSASGGSSSSSEGSSSSSGSREIRTGGCSTDIVLVLDDSSSITPTVFSSILSYMVDFTKCGNETGVGVVVFNCIPRTEVPLGLYTMGHPDLAGDIEYMIQKGGLSRTGPAIRYTKNTTPWSAGARRVMVVLTDGFVQGEPLDDHQAEADAARAAGISLYSVGIGNLVDNGVLNDIADSSSRVFDDTDPCDLYDKIRKDCDGNYTYQHAAVATDSEECSQVGADILERGGSAVDAAIAVLYCLGIKHPHSAGIGGGLFFVIYDRSRGAAEVIDAREVAPAAATTDMFGDNRNLTEVGGLAVAVPGAVKGHMEAHQRYGKLPWGELLQPAIELARSGTTVDKALAHALKSAEHKVKASPLRDVFCDKDGNILTEGKKYIMSDLSHTLDSIARHGGDVFYSGNIAANLVATIQSQGGIITKDDFENYKVDLTRPKYSDLKKAGLRMISTGPPGGGAVFEFILKTLEEFELNPKSLEGENLANTLHKIAEVFKFAAAGRTHLGDARFENVTDEVAKLTSDSFAKEIMTKIKHHGHHTSNDTKGYYGAQFYNAEDAGTTHLSVLAANGDAVAVTSTINHYFGSGVVSPSTGVILNNEMADFSSPGFHRDDIHFPPYPKNFIRPGKRPMSSTCPTIMIDKNQNVQVVIGASGGMMIPTAVAQVFANMQWFGMNLAAALDSGRIHHQLEPNILYMERKLWNNTELVQKLSHWDYNPTIYEEGSYAAVQVIRREGTEIQAFSDPRKGGKPAGY